MKFNEGLLKYGLHDTEINRIEYSDSKIIITFNSGIYFLDSKNKESEKSSKCSIIIAVDNLDINRLFEHVEIIKIYKNKCSELEFNNFIESVSINGMQVYLDYYCDFAKSIMIKGYLSKFQIEFIITEIKDISIIFENI